MKLQAVPVRRGDHAVKEIYFSSFPKEERMPYPLMRLLSLGRSTAFLSFREGDVPRGLAYLAALDSIVFVMFLAVNPALRSRGYGSEILRKLEELYPGRKLILSIERCDVPAPNHDLRVRRKAFYLKNGFVETGYFVELSRVKQELLIKNGAFDRAEFLSFLKKYSNGTLRPPVWRAEESPSRI